MKKLTTALTLAILASSAQAEYVTSGTSGTISVSAGSATSVFYTAATDGSSNTAYAPINLSFNGDWTFDFSDLNNVAFTGNVNLGDYETQTNVTGFPVIDGHISYTGANYAFSGVGSYDESSNIFSYSSSSTGSNSSGASDFTNTGASCENGKTSIFANVCGTWSGTTGDWEGLSISLGFSEDRSTFDGSIAAIEQSGSGLTANTTTINFTLDSGVNNAPSAVPVPAAAWLFGSALVGLAGLKRRK
jgi:hypothetical protein